MPGQRWTNMDALPLPDFSEYFAQRTRLFPTDPGDGVYVPYETSRGWWWGPKDHCTFCGLNGQGVAFREKTPDRIVADLRTMVASR